MVYTVNTIVTSENAAEVLAPILTRIPNVGAEGREWRRRVGKTKPRKYTRSSRDREPWDSSAALPLSTRADRRCARGWWEEWTSRRNENGIEVVSRVCKKRCILPSLFAILSLRYRTVKIPSLLENTSEDELVLSRWRNLLARVKLDNFSFQHCKLFATSSLGGGYLPSSTTLYAVTWTIAFRFIPFFLSLPPLSPKCRSLRLCVFLDFYIFSSLVDEKSSRGWQISRTKSFKALIALSSRIVILLLIAYISILSVSLLDVLLEENLTRVVDRSSKSDRDWRNEWRVIRFAESSNGKSGEEGKVCKMAGEWRAGGVSFN